MNSQDLTKIGNSSLAKLKGGIAVSSIYYDGDSSNRAPFTYFLTGNVNAKISEVFDIPFSFSYSNSEFQTNTPFSFNRLSIKPTYKWVTAYIGDVNMNFSSYTLNSHQFTGVGFDVSPNDKLTINLMYGRLLKSREFDSDNVDGSASFRRLGYGLKTSYSFDKAKIGVIFFRASDDENSLKEPLPIEIDVQPEDNTVISFNGEFDISKSFSLKGEIALSAITEDINLTGESDHFASFLLRSNVTTQYYRAYNLALSYQLGKGNIGLGYEKIDPNYRTLGGYFFNNDLENITVNASQTIFKDKLSLNVNAGIQKDDLDNRKASQLNRLVLSINIGFNANEKLSFNSSYSSFQSFTNIKNQFDFINGVSQIEEDLDRDNIAQISQNTNLSINYILDSNSSKKRNLNLNFSFQDAENKIGDEIREEDSSVFYTGNASYSIAYLNSNVSISGAFNSSLSNIQGNENLFLGPALSLKKSYLDKKLRFNATIGHNRNSINGEKNGDVSNIRIGSQYAYKKTHNFNLNALFQLRNKNQTESTKNFTLTFRYNYNFGLFDSKNIKPRSSSENAKKVKVVKNYNRPVKFSYKERLYEGTVIDVNSQIGNLVTSPKFNKIPKSILNKIDDRLRDISTENDNEVYKGKAIQLLKDIYGFKTNVELYNKFLFAALVNLFDNVEALNYEITEAYILNKSKLTTHKLWAKPKEILENYPEGERKELELLQKAFSRSKEKLVFHEWVIAQIKDYNNLDKVTNRYGIVKKFTEQQIIRVNQMITNREHPKAIESQLEKLFFNFLVNEFKFSVNKSELENLDLKQGQ